MIIKNKRDWNVVRKNINGDYVIYEEYEKDIINSLNELLSNKLSVLLNDNGILYFSIDNRSYYCISDNGGEFNLEKLNCGLPLSIPYSSYSYVLISVNTMAYRLYLAIKDESLDNIDWNKRL
ncbi:MAG: hypothetical protein E7E64_05150 [Clostridium celatum]|uniref:hypothetical protein n=1 Tax=Clostridium tertium TaxID=1559 RepID=UPI0028FEE0F1|nr:hypothetical protein [Clostridium celatum]